MDIQFGRERYRSEFFEDCRDGFAGLRLHRECFGKTSIAAEVTYWDATGGFTIKTIDGVVQVEIIEALIAEAKQRIPVK